jgi:hypothetical protein
MDADIIAATRAYETWLASRIPVVRADLRLKHERMRESPFVFLRGTFYRWIERWPTLCRASASAPRGLAVGDLHVENFGTWRDAEGRLIWGVNDVDEACELPYTQDLVRLATSACLAAQERRFALSNRVMCDAILEGYAGSLAHGGRPFVLAERHCWLRDVALGKLRDPEIFWSKLLKLPPGHGAPRAALRSALPRGAETPQISRRVAGVGSLGRPRFVAIAECAGGYIAREAKAWLPSAANRAGVSGSGDIGNRLLERSIRAADPAFAIRRPWIVRRLAPDCSRIELDDLPRERDERKLLHAMGWETANMQGCGGAHRTAIVRDLSARKADWLLDAAAVMVDATEEDWRAWKRQRRIV